MQLSNFKYYRNLYSDCYYTQITFDETWTGFHTKIIPEDNNNFVVYIGTPTRGTLQLVGCFKGLSNSKRIAVNALINEYIK